MFNFKFKPQNPRQWKNPSEGLHTAAVVGITDPAEVEGMDGVKYQAFRYILEIVDEMTDGEDPKFLTVRTKNMRCDSLHPKSNLYKFASAVLRTKELVPEMLPDPSALFGKFVDVIISHNKSEDGQKTYANIDSVLACKNPPADFNSTYVAPLDKE